MKRYKPDGNRIKRLRADRERRSTQKEFAHEIRISERRLRLIENTGASVTADELERIAGALGVHRQCILRHDEGPSPPLIPPAAPPRNVDAGGILAPVLVPAQKKTQVFPRFDKESLRVVRDGRELFEHASGSKRLLVHSQTSLSAETEGYAAELVEILESLTWEKRSTLDPIGGQKALGIHRRLRELLVLLKGNDVWVYATGHVKYVPESFEIEPEVKREMEMQAIIAFGAPGEYGEDSIYVSVDNGRPIVVETRF